MRKTVWYRSRIDGCIRFFGIFPAAQADETAAKMAFIGLVVFVKEEN
jgi:hypothetical protein